MWYDRRRKKYYTNSAALIIAIVVIIARAVLAIRYSAVAAGIALNCDGIVQGRVRAWIVLRS